MKFKKQNQNGRSFVDSYNFTNKANSHAFEVGIHTLQKLCHFGRYDAKAKLFYKKSFVPVTRAEVFIWENFIPVTEISVAKTMISVTGLWTHRNFYGGRSGEAKSRKPSQPGWPGSYEEALNHSKTTRALMEKELGLCANFFLFFSLLSLSLVAFAFFSRSDV